MKAVHRPDDGTRYRLYADGKERFLVEANRYAAVVSGLSVASPHTIDPDLTAERVRRRLSGDRTSQPGSDSREEIS